MNPLKRDFVMMRDGTIHWCETQGGMGHLDYLAGILKVDPEDLEDEVDVEDKMDVLERMARHANVIRGVYVQQDDVYVAAPYAYGPINNAQWRELRDLAIISRRKVTVETDPRGYKELLPESKARLIIDATVNVNRPDNTAANAAIDDFMKMANGVWMAPFIVTETGLLELSAWEGKIHLGFIGATKKGQGDGSKLLKLLCQAADKHRVAIEGSIQASENSQLDNSQLAFWYERHGFDVTSDGEYMERPPGGS